jgi:tetratricopeptide (TPR) repeat protein/O-antigen ligase
MWSNFERMEGWVTLAHLLLYFLVVGTTVQTGRMWWYLANTSIAASIFLGIHGIFQLAGLAEIHQGSTRLDASLGNSTYFAVYLLFHLFITALLSYYVWLRRKALGSTAHLLYGFYAAVGVLQLVMLYFTGTRGAILGFIGGVILTGLLLSVTHWRRSPGLRYTGMALLTAVVLAVGSFFALKDTALVQNNPVLSRFADISLEDGTAKARLNNWSMAWQGFQERPVLGWGQESFNFIFNKYVPAEMHTEEPWFDRAHNIFFDWLVAGGILGVIGYFAIPVVAMYYIWFYRRSEQYFDDVERSILTGLGAGYFFHQMFVFDNLVSYILYFTVLAFIYSRVRQKVRPGTLMGFQLKPDAALYYGGPAIAIALIASLYFVNYLPIQAATGMIDALRASQQGNYQQALEEFEWLSQDYNMVGRQEIAEQLTQTATRVANSSASMETQQSFKQLAQNAMGDLINDVPNDARTRLFYASMFRAYGDNQKALTHFEKAEELSPEKQLIDFSLAQTYLDVGEDEQALETMREAFELAPSNENARTGLAALLIRDGQVGEAKQLLTEGFGTTTVTNSRVINAYSNAGNYRELLPIMQKRIREDPSNAQNYVSLAAVYLQLNQQEQAVQVVERAIDRNPNFEQRGRQIINQIRGSGAQQQ